MPEQKSLSSYQARQQAEIDPFCNPMLNDIFKPIMAIDRLSTLRRDKICFDIQLQNKDLKVLTKERRAELNALLE